jgi:hypothetical protein
MHFRHPLRRLACAAILFLNVGAATAFERPFPAATKRGIMTPAPHPIVVIDGQNRQLAPGARIWNQDNLIEMPAALRGSNLPVRYTLDSQGDVDRIWILTPEEAQRRNSP